MGEEDNDDDTVETRLNDLQYVEAKEPVIRVGDASAADSLSPLVVMAMSKDLSPERLNQLLDVQQRWESNEADKAYHQALASFKAEELEIEKDRLVEYNETSYRFASLGRALMKINPLLARYGLSMTWRTRQDLTGGGLITVTAVLTHRQGHSEETSLSASPDSSGKKNPIQAVASTVSYLKRHTAFCLLGVASLDEDDDAQSWASEESEFISDQQYMDLKAMMSEVGADEEKFLKYLGVGNLRNLRSDLYDRAIEALEHKRKQ